MRLIPDMKFKSESMRQLLWLGFGVMYGLMMRLLTDAKMLDMDVISISFMLGTPFVVGAIVIYGFRYPKPTIAQMIFAPWGAILLAMFGASISLLEGLICIILALPIFLVVSSIGGLVMGFVLRRYNAGSHTLNSFLALPLAMLVAEPAIPHKARVIEERVSIEVAAEPHKIWMEILTARDIRREELPLNFTHLIGVPRPVEGVNVVTPQGEVRHSQWERGVNFSALVMNKVEDRTITWRYKFDDDSFPKGSMDDHVKIGGRYFDLHDTTFNLIPISDKLTRLEIVSHYRVTTNVNFYAIPIARYIANDFMSTILSLYKSRSENS